MLEVRHGLVVVPVGLDDHTLYCRTAHAPHVRALALDRHRAVALLATALPLGGCLVRLARGRWCLGAELGHGICRVAHQGVDALARDGRNSMEGMPVCLGGLAERLDGILGTRHVALVSNHDLRAIGQLVGIGSELCVDGAIVLDGIAAFEATRHVNHVQDKSCALDVSQELVAQALAFRGAFDEPGDVGTDKRATVTSASHAQVGDKRGEGVLGNLGTSGRDARDDGTLPHRRHSHEGSVGHELHLKLDPVLLGRLALLGKRRRTAHGGHKVRVAEAAHTSRGHNHTLARAGEVGNLVDGLLRCRVKLAHHGSQRHAKHEVRTVLTVHALSLAVRAAFGLEVVLIAIVDKGRELRVCLDDHVTAMAAVAAVRASLGNVGLAAERHTSRAAVATLDVDMRQVCECDHGFLLGCP